MPDDFDRTTPEVAPQPSRRWLYAALVALGVIAVLGFSLAFQPVRTFAAQVLSIFRVQNIATISITPDDLDQIGEALERGDAHVSLKELGDVWVDGKPGMAAAETTLTTLAAAQSAVDFPVQVPSGVKGTRSVAIQRGTSVKFRLHIDKVNALLRYYGAEKLFSKSLDNKTFEIKMAPTVYVTYGEDALDLSASDDAATPHGDAATVDLDPSTQDVAIVQTRGPELIVPSGVNPLEIRDVILNLPFLPQNIRTQLSGVTNWQNTLLIPNVSGSTREILVAGNSGVVITPPRDTGEPDDSFAVVMWQQDGVLRAVGTSSEKRSLAIAESMAK